MRQCSRWHTSADNSKGCDSLEEGPFCDDDENTDDTHRTEQRNSKCKIDNVSGQCATDEGSAHVNCQWFCRWHSEVNRSNSRPSILEFGRLGVFSMFSIRNWLFRMAHHYNGSGVAEWCGGETLQNALHLHTNRPIVSNNAIQPHRSLSWWLSFSHRSPEGFIMSFIRSLWLCRCKAICKMVISILDFAAHRFGGSTASYCRLSSGLSVS